MLTQVIMIRGLQFYCNCNTLTGTHEFVTQDMCAQPHIGLLTNLTELYLQNNNISVVDERIGCCINLAVLDISNNAITSLPYTMYQPSLLHLAAIFQP